MDNTSKTSIAAIIFTMVFFLFVIFISLFHGITLYNIKSNNLKIGNIFFKIDKKIILQINNIKILPTKNYNKEVIKIHQTFYLISKILPFFEKLELNNIYENNTLLIKKLDLNKNNFIIKTPYLSSKGKILIKKDKTSVLSKKISFLNYKIKNFSFTGILEKNKIKADIKALFNNKKFYINLVSYDNKIDFQGKTDKILFSYNNINIKAKNISIKGKLNLNSNKIKLNLHSPFIHIQNKNILINSFDNNINLTNNYLTLKSKKGNIAYNLKKLNLKNYDLYFYIPQRLLLAHAKQTKTEYKNYTLNSQNTEFDYNLINQNIFLHTNNLIFNNDINASVKEALIIKNKKLYYKLSNDKLLHKYFNLKTNYIKGNLKKIDLADILGKILTFDVMAKSPKIDLKQKKAVTQKILFNKIEFTNNKFDFSKKPFKFSSHTDTLFNQSVKDILNYFHINIPFIQTKGYNDINFSVNSDLNKTDINYQIFSKDSNFSINPKNQFSYQKMQLKGDLNKSDITLNNFKFTNDFINELSDANITVNLNQKYLNAFINIKHLKIDDYLNVKNFYEKLVIDLSKNYAYLMNSFIFINLKQKIIYLYSLKPLLKYTIFNEIFQNARVIIRLLKNQTDISAKAVLNYPFILNQKNPKKLNANIILKNGNIIIKNKFINTEIMNFEKVISYVKNIDIDIQGLINIIDTTKKLAGKKEKSNKPVKVVIIGKNTNFVYKTHKFLTTEATLTFNKELNFTASYKKSTLKGYTKNNYLLIEGKNYTKEALVPLFDFFKHFNNINLDFVSVKSPDDFYTGKIYINSASVKDLAALNNIIAFINTIPALLSLKTPGFSAKGYKIKNGFISYLFYNNILYFKQIKIKGVNIDFDAKGFVNLNKNLIKLKIHTIVKLKLKNIPIIGKAISYLFFGKDGYLHINIFVNGDLNNPKVSKDLGGGIIESPLKLFKRILTLPFNIF